MTYPCSSSSSCYLEFEEALPRSWNAAKYTRDYEYSWNRFDGQHAQRDPDELHNYSRNLATPLGITDNVEDFEKRRN